MNWKMSSNERQSPHLLKTGLFQHVFLPTTAAKVIWDLPSGWWIVFFDANWILLSVDQCLNVCWCLVSRLALIKAQKLLFFRNVSRVTCSHSVGLRNWFRGTARPLKQWLYWFRGTARPLKQWLYWVYPAFFDKIISHRRLQTMNKILPAFGKKKFFNVQGLIKIRDCFAC